MLFHSPTRKFSFWALPTGRYASLLIVRLTGCLVYSLMVVYAGVLLIFAMSEPSIYEDAIILLSLVALAFALALLVTFGSIVRDRFSHAQIAKAQPSRVSEINSALATANLWQLHSADFARPKYFPRTIRELYTSLAASKASARERAAVIVGHAAFYALIFGLAFSAIITQNDVLIRLLGLVAIAIVSVSLVYSMLLPYQAQPSEPDSHTSAPLSDRN